MCANYNGFRSKKSSKKPGRFLKEEDLSKDELIFILSSNGYDSQYLLRMTKKELLELATDYSCNPSFGDIYFSFAKLDDDTEF